MNPILWTASLIGHIGFWCIVYNRTHATSWPRRVRKRCERLTIVMVLTVFVWILLRAWQVQSLDFRDVAWSGIAERLYLIATCLMGCFFFLRWSWRKFKPKPASLVSQSRRVINVQTESGVDIYQTPLAKALKRIPFNQSHLIAIENITLSVPGLPAELDGMRICHLSDFHFTGQLDRVYFERIVAEANAFDADLVVITGDLIDELHCLDWIETVLGQLRSRHGTYVIRGNHDVRIADRKLLLNRIKAASMHWIGGQCETISIAGRSIGLCGNELPWFDGAEQLDPAMFEACDLRILLTHTPDQIEWVRDNGFKFDLILAGHNHGGQIAIPVVGPIVAPSKFGVLYASGTFEVDGAIMHVSRGIAGDECIRINCPPELGFFTLASFDQ